MRKFSGAIQHIRAFSGTQRPFPKFRGSMIWDEKIIPVFPAMPDPDPYVPPVIAAYLYGTPSPTIVTYNGVELPELPEWDKTAYPYAYINISSSGQQQFFAYTKPLKYGTHTANGVTYTKPYFTVNGGEKVQYLGTPITDGKWRGIQVYTLDHTNDTGTFYVRLNEVIWSNTDIPNIDNNTTYLAASEPVYSQVGGNVALADGEGYVLYNGAVLPPLPEWDKSVYPYAILQKGNNFYRLYVASAPPYVRVLSGTEYIYEATGASYKLGWELHANNNSWISIIAAVPLAAYPIFWANCDIKYEDGGTYLAASDPIPLASDEPVAVVYGSVKLPDIETVWTDKATYPFAFVYSFTNNGVANYILMLLPQVPYVGYLSSSTVRLDGCAVSATPHLKQYKSVAGVWEDQNFGYATASLEYYPASTPIIWASGDLAKTDGTVYLAASEPVPVYERKE